MNDYLFIAVQAYGDNVISLRLLSELRGRAELRILGTQLTLEIAGVTGFDAFPITPVPKGLFAFYNVGDEGLWNAARDFFDLRRSLRSLVGPGTTVLFENQRRPRTHRLLQLTAGNFRYEQPQPGDSAYADRRRMLERVFGCEIALPAAARPAGKVRKVLIAPAARKGFRAFPHATVTDLLDYFGARGAEVCLVDAAGQYAELRERVASYIAQRALATSVAQLKQADLVIAPDSLFLHLAYSLGIPAVALVPEVIARDFYFAPPGLLEGKLFQSFDVARDRARLFGYLDSLSAT